MGDETEMAVGKKEDEVKSSTNLLSRLKDSVEGLFETESVIEQRRAKQSTPPLMMLLLTLYFLVGVWYMLDNPYDRTISTYLTFGLCGLMGAGIFGYRRSGLDVAPRMVSALEHISLFFIFSLVGTYVISEIAKAITGLSAVTAVSIPEASLDFDRVTRVLFRVASEEFFFRGPLFLTWSLKMRERFGRYGEIASVITSAATFAVFHKGRPLVESAVLFWLGAVWGYITIRTQSIFSSSIMHAMWNILSSANGSV